MAPFPCSTPRQGPAAAPSRLCLAGGEQWVPAPARKAGSEQPGTLCDLSADWVRRGIPKLTAAGNLGDTFRCPPPDWVGLGEEQLPGWQPAPPAPVIIQDAPLYWSSIALRSSLPALIIGTRPASALPLQKGPVADLCLVVEGRGHLGIPFTSPWGEDSDCNAIFWGCPGTCLLREPGSEAHSS